VSGVPDEEVERIDVSEDSDVLLVEAASGPVSVNAERNSLSDSGFARLAACPRVRRLDLSGGSTPPDGFIASLRALGDLRCLDLGELAMDHEQAKALADLDLEVLGVWSCGLDAESIAGWRHPRLREITLGMNDLDGAAVAALAARTPIVSLDASGVGFGQASLRALSRVRAFDRLVLSECGLDDSGFALLANQEKLRVLEVGDNDLSDASLPALAKMTNLRRLRLQGNRFSKDAVAAIVRLERLELVGLPAECLDAETTDRLRRMPHLEWLETEDGLYGIEEVDDDGG
jgi:hypothetical protein